ncbi:MAG: site-specific integrase [Lachnospiraceae bacterium]|nr:site-specific integrase [Lachnospiraceae bacterium]
MGRRSKGEGSFHSLPSGKILYRKSVGRLANGGRKVISVTASSKAACIQAMRRKEEEWNRSQENSIEAFEGYTVTQLCNEHLQYQISNKELKPKSIDRREVTINQHIAPYNIGRKNVKTLKGADVEDHIMLLKTNTKLSASSIVKTIDVLNASYAWAIRRGELSYNPVLPVRDTLKKQIARMVEKNAEQADVIVFSAEEEKSFVQETKKCYNNGKVRYPSGIYLRLLLRTGVRCGELLALKWKEVNLEQGYIVIKDNRVTIRNRDDSSDKRQVQHTDTTKNDRARTIRLIPEAYEIIKEIYSRGHHIDPDDYVAITKKNTPYTTSNLEHGVAAVYKNAGLEQYKSSLHILRRTFATNMYQSGARIKDVAAYIGDLESTTEKYYIAVRKKIRVGNEDIHIIEPPINSKGAGGD